MKLSVLAICLAASPLLAQVREAKAAPEIKTITIENGTVTQVFLSPGYTTSIRLPEEIRSVVIGNPASFKAEHADSEPRSVFLKPVTARAAESNALITTKSGQQISLHLISSGQMASSQSKVDFLLEYKHSQSAVIDADSNRSFFISETKGVPEAAALEIPDRSKRVDPLNDALAQQQAVASPAWQGQELQAALGESIQVEQQTILRFSILNNTKHPIELLPPQVELSGKANSGKGKQIKAEPVAIADYRMTERRLKPGERADGVVIFDRPTFKESTEKLELQLAEADQVDRPLLLPIPFTATTVGGGQ
jgi:hypothetical protein